jgi:HPt (histidine-containing phosphotransfer) domain-containing protein
LASISRDTATIVEGVASGDRPMIVEAAHRVKGTSGSIGACRLIEISSKIEGTIARSAAMVDAAALDELYAALAELRADVAAYIPREDM